MQGIACKDSYPLGIVFVVNIVAILVYAAGVYVISRLGLLWLVLYLLYIVWLEIRLLRKSCVDCFYYGKTCAFGKGKLAAVFLKKGDPGRFAARKITWKDIIPDFLVSVIPIIAGIILLIMDFNWPLLAAVVLILLLTSAGNGFVRGSLACKDCRQRETGCPAAQLFAVKKA